MEPLSFDERIFYLILNSSSSESLELGFSFRQFKNFGSKEYNFSNY